MGSPVVSSSGRRDCVISGGESGPESSLIDWVCNNPLYTFVVTMVMWDWVPAIVGRELGYADVDLSGTKLWLGPVFISIVLSQARAL